MKLSIAETSDQEPEKVEVGTPSDFDEFDIRMLFMNGANIQHFDSDDKLKFGEQFVTKLEGQVLNLEEARDIEELDKSRILDAIEKNIEKLVPRILPKTNTMPRRSVEFLAFWYRIISDLLISDNFTPSNIISKQLEYTDLFQLRYKNEYMPWIEGNIAKFIRDLLDFDLNLVELSEEDISHIARIIAWINPPRWNKHQEHLVLKWVYKDISVEYSIIGLTLCGRPTDEMIKFILGLDISNLDKIKAIVLHCIFTDKMDNTTIFIRLLAGGLKTNYRRINQ